MRGAAAARPRPRPSRARLCGAQRGTGRVRDGADRLEDGGRAGHERLHRVRGVQERGCVLRSRASRGRLVASAASIAARPGRTARSSGGSRRIDAWTLCCSAAVALAKPAALSTNRRTSWPHGSEDPVELGDAGLEMGALALRMSINRRVCAQRGVRTPQDRVDVLALTGGGDPELVEQQAQARLFGARKTFSICNERGTVVRVTGPVGERRR